MLGAFFVVGQETSDQFAPSGILTRNTNTIGSVELRVGRRWWTSFTNEPMRPFLGLGIGGRFAQFSGVRTTEGSVNGELGATYFFSPHVSLGATGELALVRGQDRYANPTGPSQTADHWYLHGNVARLNAAVYF
jgi:hypothetical protein